MSVAVADINIANTKQPAIINQHKSLKQRVAEFYGKDFETVLKEHPYVYEETDWGVPVGEEIW